MNEQYLDIIHRYLNGSMDTSERQTFEAEMESKPALKNDVALERALLAGLERSGDEGVRKTIGEVHQGLKQEGFFDAPNVKPIHSLTSKTFVMNRILAVAATLVILLGGVWFFRGQVNQVDTNALYSQHFKPENEAERAREIIASLESYGLAGVQTDADTLKMALELYEAGSYKESLALLKPYAETHPENDTAQYYMGVIHMAEERYAKAIELLLPISRSEESGLKNDALWNLGLCYLKTNNGEQDARDAFLKLSEDNSYTNHRGAKAVLDQLLPEDK